MRNPRACFYDHMISPLYPLKSVCSATFSKAVALISNSAAFVFVNPNDSLPNGNLDSGGSALGFSISCTIASADIFSDRGSDPYGCWQFSVVRDLPWCPCTLLGSQA